MPSVAIVLINWDNEADTIDCINSLNKISYPNYKIFLVDNGSKENSVRQLRSFAGEKLELIENKANLGFSGGNNVGFKKALEENFDYVLALNNDTTVQSNFLEELVMIAQSDYKIGVAGPKIYFYSVPNRIWYGGGTFSWFRASSHLQLGDIDDAPNEEEAKETQYMTGCALMIKSSLLKEIGDFCEDYFIYYEDTDLSLRARKAGYKIMYAPSSKIYHKVTRSISKIGNPRIHYYHTRNFLLLTRRLAPWHVKLTIYIYSFLNYTKQVLKILLFPSKREISKMIKLGIEDFYSNKFGQIKQFDET